MNEKKFDQWNTIKKQLNAKTSFKIIQERDVVFLCMGENVGFEQNGKGKEFLRPVLVYKKFSQHTFLGIPLTRTNKNHFLYFPFSIKRQKSTAILSQIKLFDVRRVKYFLSRMESHTFLELKKRLIEVLQ